MKFVKNVGVQLRREISRCEPFFRGVETLPNFIRESRVNISCVLDLFYEWEPQLRHFPELYLLEFRHEKHHRKMKTKNCL